MSCVAVVLVLSRIGPQKIIFRSGLLGFFANELGSVAGEGAEVAVLVEGAQDEPLYAGFGELGGLRHARRPLSLLLQVRLPADGAACHSSMGACMARPMTHCQALHLQT